MPQVADCPNDATLRELLLGTLDDKQMGELGSHLLACRRCATRAGTVQAADELTQSLQTGETLLPDPHDPLVERLRSGLHQLRSLPLSSAPNGATLSLSAATESSVSSPRQTSAAEGKEHSYSFLAPPQTPDEIGRLGSYRVLKVLGQGGMGVVFQAEDIRLGRLCALKAMLPEITAKPGMKERFLREARAAAQIEHDHIIPVYQVDEDRGIPYIAMPFLKGMALDDWIRKQAKSKPDGASIPVPVILKLGRQIAKGLAAAHDRGLVHRDIKPANIWLDASAGGRVKILDFGLARLSETVDQQHLTQTGMIMGTPSHMAPEQARGEKLDGRADLFSLGVILYRLCTGVLPFQGKDTMGTLMALATHTPPAPHAVNPAIPRPLSELVMRLLEKEPARRTPSAQQLIADLQKVERSISGSEIESPALTAASAETAGGAANDASAIESFPQVSIASRPPASSLRSPRALWPLIAAGAGAAALLLAGIIVYWQTRQGTVRIEINDPSITAQIDANGVDIKKGDEQFIRLAPGPHGLRIKHGKLEFETDKFVLPKGETIDLKIERLTGEIRVTADDKPIGLKPLSVPASAVARGPQTTTAASAAETMTTPATRQMAIRLNEKYQISNHSLKVDFSRPFTLEAWITPVHNEAARSGVIRVAYMVGLSIMQAADGDNWDFTMGNGPSARVRLTYGENKPVHVACVRTAQEFVLYINGRVAARRNLPSEPLSNEQIFAIGDVTSQPCVLWMDEIRISKVARYVKEFTPASRFEPEDDDTLALYHCDEGSGEFLNDSSGNGYHCRVDGGEWVNVHAELATGGGNQRWTEIFNGFDLTGWKHYGPEAAGWSVKDGVLIGEPTTQGGWLLTDRDYSDFELKLDYRLAAGGNSGVFLRANPDGPPTGSANLEVQLYDAPDLTEPNAGTTGSIWSMIPATKLPKSPAGQWNSMHIHAVGRRVQVAINGEQLLDADLDNVGPPAPKNPGLQRTSGRIGLQLYPPRIEFRNIRVLDRSAATLTNPAVANGAIQDAAAQQPSAASDGWANLFNGRNLTGWKPIGYNGWRVENDLLVGEANDQRGWLMSQQQFSDFELEMEYKLFSGGNGGVFLRAWEHGNTNGGDFTEVQFLDGAAPQHANLTASQTTGSINGKYAANPLVSAPANVWNRLQVRLQGQRVQVTVNGVQVVDFAAVKDTKPGHIGLQLFSGQVRALRVRQLTEGTAETSSNNATATPETKTDAASVTASRVNDGVKSHPPAATGPSAQQADLALKFDETTQISMKSLDVDVSRPFTLEAWVTPWRDQYPNGCGLVRLNPTMGLRINGGHGGGSPWVFSIGIGAPAVSRSTVAANKRVHVAGVRTETELILYINGRVEGRVPVDHGPYPTERTSTLGTSGYYAFNGTLNEIRISQVARYEKEFTPAARFEPDNATVALYHCDEGSGALLTDASGNGYHCDIDRADWVETNATSAQDRRQSQQRKPTAPVESLRPAVDSSSSQEVNRITNRTSPAKSTPAIPEIWTLRSIAQWSIELGGKVLLGDGHVISKVENLPDTLDRIDLVDFTGLKSSFGDAEAKIAGAWPRIKGIAVSDTAITDAGLQALGALPLGNSFSVAATTVSGEGFEKLRGKSLGTVSVSGCSLSDEGWRHLSHIGSTSSWHLQFSNLSDAALARIVAVHPEIETLNASCFDVTNASADRIAELPGIKTLVLNTTSLSDEGLLKFAALRSLKLLQVKQTKVTAAGVERLRQTLPNCTIEWK